MKVLQITNDFSSSKVYVNLFSKLDEYGIIQSVYAPIRDKKLAGNNSIKFKTNESAIVYRHILNILTRVNLFHKCKKIVTDLNRCVSIQHINLIHAHTWFSDGAVAYSLFRLHKIPYVVTIRNTDVNVFFKYLVYLRPLGLKILLHAQKVIFISPLYLSKVLNHSYFRKIKNHLQHKSICLPNGVSDYWFDNIHMPPLYNLNKIPEILYVGNFERNKNVKTLIKTVLFLNNTGFRCKLNLIGSGGFDQKWVIRCSRKYPNLIAYFGRISEQMQLRQIYRSNDVFVMISKTETFGLVYLEALSQGLPIIFTKGEGIDGLFSDDVGLNVDHSNIRDIASTIRKILTNKRRFHFDPNPILMPYKWDIISKRYLEIYEGLDLGL